MNWDFDGEGGWDALSSVGDDGVMFSWRIIVCDDGTFSVNESDSELTDRKETFSTLQDAKAWCAVRDEEFRLGCSEPPRCKECGYTAEDAATHMDHHLCSGDIPSA